MSQTLDINRLRDTLLNNQSHGTTFPQAAGSKVLVTNQGEIRTGDELSPTERNTSSEVPQEIFAALAVSRAERDARTVARKLPSNTVAMAFGGLHGWAYQIVPTFPSRHGLERFVFFLCHDGDAYQVYCVQPELEHHWRSPHTGHIFSDGRLCLGVQFNSGAPNLESAYAKSVVWAEGIQVARQTGQFPFSINNAHD